MTLLAQMRYAEKIFERFGESLSPVHFLVLAVLLAVSLYVAVKRKSMLALLCLMALSLLTAARHDAVASGALLGRWYFVGLAALAALMRPTPGHGTIVGLFIAWVGMNLFGIIYTADVQTGAIRALYFTMLFPAVMFSMAPPNQTPDTLVRFIRQLASVGVLVAVVHLVFIVLLPNTGEGGRFTSFSTSPQLMALATANITLPMVWTLVSKNAGKLHPFILAGVLVNVIMIIASTQRAAIFSLFGATLIMMLYYRTRGFAVVGVTALTIVGLMGPVIGKLVAQEYLTERVLSTEATARTQYWASGISEGMRAPVLGHGSGAATQLAGMLFGMKLHQAYIAVFYDFGIIGVFIFLGLLFFGALLAYQLTRRKTPKLRGLGVFLLASIAMCAAQGIVETGLADTANQTATLFYISLGMAAAAIKMREPTVEERSFSRAPAGSSVRPAYPGLQPGAPGAGHSAK